jgi:hypothetical protein
VSRPVRLFARALRGLVLAAPLLFVANARATEIGDGEELVVKLREDALVCIHTPPPAHPDPACAQFGSPPRSDTAKGPIRVVSSGIVRVPGSEQGALGITVLVRAKVPFVSEPETNADAMEYAREYAGGVAKSLPPARVHAGDPTASIWKVDGIPLIRFAFDLDGVPEDRELMQHHVGFAASSRDARYTLVFSSRTADADVLDTFANESVASLRLPHRAPTRSYLIGYWVGTFLGVVIMVAVAVVVVIVLVRRGRRRTGPAGLPPFVGPPPR